MFNVKNNLKKLRIIMALVVLLVFVLSQNGIAVFALTQAQKDAIKSGALYFNTEEDGEIVQCGNESTYTALFPAITDDAQLAEAMRAYIVDEGFASSPLIPHMNLFVSIGRELNVNPVMLLGIAREDTGMATTGHGPPPEHNFGNIRDHENGGWRSWPNYPAAIRGHYEHLRGGNYLGPPSNFTTVDQVINRWAPPEDDNDTAGYIRDVKALMAAILGSLGLTQSNVNCACGGGSLPGGGGNTVVLDPGHGPNHTSVDQATGLRMVESHNVPETSEMWDVAQKVRQKLQSSGYTVLLTKQSELDQVTFRQRANVANNNKAAIAVSLHDDHTQSYDGFKQVWPQRVGQYRGQGSNRTEFTNAAVAEASQRYAQIMKEERERVEGGNVVISNFQARDGMEPGNIPMVMLFSTVPWIYHEVGGGSGRLSDNQLEQYAEGVANGIKRSVPTIPGGAPTTGQNMVCACSDALIAKAKLFAWPEYHEANYFDMKPEYEAAIRAAQARGEYVGGGAHPGIDCGGYVTRAVRDSGAEPRYNGYQGPTTDQKRWMDDHPELYENIGTPASTAELEPGDIAINTGHTFFYLGSAGFPGYNAADASIDTFGNDSWRSPMANNHSTGGYTWYRLKCPANSTNPPSGTRGTQ